MSQSWRAFVLMGLFIQSMASPALGVIDQKLLDDLANDTTDLFISETIGPRIQDNIPLVSSSSAFTFRWDSELEVWQRSERTSGGIFLERAEPLGRGRIDFSISYAYVKYDEINGRDLSDELRTTDENGALYTFHVRDAEAQLANFTLTYGLNDRIDVSLVVPVERIYIVSSFTVAEANGDVSTSNTDRREHVGVGDIVMRGKWQALESKYANIATGLELKVPSGDPDKALGLGDTRLTPWLYASQIYAGRIEPHAQAGFEINLAYAQKSRFAWGAGLDVGLFSAPRSALQNVGLVAEAFGRTDLDAPDDDNPNSFFGQARQRNIMDMAVGFKLAFAHEVLIFFATQFPLNSDGLRAEFIPVGGLEAAF
jgi:hypothetical protein